MHSWLQASGRRAQALSSYNVIFLPPPPPANVFDSLMCFHPVFSPFPHSSRGQALSNNQGGPLGICVQKRKDAKSRVRGGQAEPGRRAEVTAVIDHRGLCGVPVGMALWCTGDIDSKPTRTSTMTQQQSS